MTELTEAWAALEAFAIDEAQQRGDLQGTRLVVELVGNLIEAVAENNRLMSSIESELIAINSKLPT